MLDRLLKNETSWEYIKNSGKEVVIYGTGNGADKVIDEFDRLGIEIKGVTASDGFVRDRFFRGFKVKRLSEFDGDIIIVVAFASSIESVTEHIFSLCEKYDVIVPCVPVIGNEIFNREFAEKNFARIEAAYELFDERSKRIYEGCVEFLLSGRLDILEKITTEKDEVFESVLKLGENESYLDLGAYRGDTVDEFLRHCGGKYERITAVEPDKKTYAKLCEHIKNLPNMTAVNSAISDKDGTVCFSQAAGRQSSISEKGRETACVCIDSLCKNQNVTYIKMDIEGAEQKAISGGKNVIVSNRPKLNIALYHRSEDVFAIPLLIKKLVPDYEFHLRRHPYIPCWDMNLYCVDCRI